MEAFLHYVWESRLWTELIPEGILEGTHVEIIDVGLRNIHAGPDFFEAKVKIDNILWVGSIEIHRKASEWLRHQHHLDPEYRGTILHVVEVYDEEVLGYNARPLPTLIMRYEKSLQERAEYLCKYANSLPCAPLGERVDEKLLYGYLDKLMQERLYSKAKQILRLVEERDWHEALYITLMRYLGLDLNNDAMEALAKSLPHKIIGRYVDRPLQLSALLLGQANLIDTVTDPEDREQLAQEYDFLRLKHQLTPIKETWKYARTRPKNFPERRISQIAQQLCNPTFTPSALLKLKTLKELQRFFEPITGETNRSLVINVALPFICAKALEYHGESQLLTFIEEEAIVREIAPESNRITRMFTQAGIKLRHAGDTQAVTQLYKEYCKRHKCLYCSLGRHLLSRYKSIK